MLVNMNTDIQCENENLRDKLVAQVMECRELQEVNEELQRKNEKLRGKLDAQVTKNRDLKETSAILGECIYGLEA